MSQPYQATPGRQSDSERRLETLERKYAEILRRLDRVEHSAQASQQNIYNTKPAG